MWKLATNAGQSDRQTEGENHTLSGECFVSFSETHHSLSQCALQFEMF